MRVSTCVGVRTGVRACQSVRVFVKSTRLET